MRNLTCIVCPIGCSLEIDEDSSSPDSLSVTGNNCPRGIVYAHEEIRAPKRVVTATCPIDDGAAQSKTAAHQQEASSVRRIPVKTSSPCPKEKIPALLADIYKTKVTLPVKMGDILIAGWNRPAADGEGIDVVATRSLNA